MHYSRNKDASKFVEFASSGAVCAKGDRLLLSAAERTRQRCRLLAFAACRASGRQGVEWNAVDRCREECVVLRLGVTASHEAAAAERQAADVGAQSDRANVQRLCRDAARTRHKSWSRLFETGSPRDSNSLVNVCLHCLIFLF